MKQANIWGCHDALIRNRTFSLIFLLKKATIKVCLNLRIKLHESQRTFLKIFIKYSNFKMMINLKVIVRLTPNNVTEISYKLYVKSIVYGIV